ncbi:cyclic nucleotide-binding domain-containing protein [candidate division KSB3 bacterium]|uniref:Cyclic nucleotide-binding domain-containing protein n=1 Tax=candidate division KSB3 bacterium TaxID=2044937 RepID=A0A9D5JXK2_9BACT|nr:cyclic nucleotide-binding domain-containing protein [candidate division KSB3 bacterium]MBD3326162.1 cyclic nucleotide-binding domain-containing protein [candidate division KSB3 bacterium]
MTAQAYTPLSPAQKAEKAQEIEYYQRIIKKMPGFTPFSVNAHLKIGQLYTELGDKDAAIHAYSNAAMQYAHNGALLKALAVNKIIIELAPEKHDLSPQLSDLYFQRGELTEFFAPPVGKVSSFQLPCREDDPGHPQPDDRDAEEQATWDERPEGQDDEAEIAAYLKQHPLFCQLSWIERQWLEENGVVHHFDVHETILPEDHDQESLFIILEGAVNIVSRNENQQNRILTQLQAGDFFGEVSLLTHHQSGVSVVAAEVCTLVEFSKPVFATIVKKHPHIADTLKASSTQRVLDSKLAHVSLFIHLDTTERQQIAEHLSPVSFTAGTTILREGDQGDCMYLIKSGSVGVYTTLLMEGVGIDVPQADQQDLHLATLGESDFFGEQALITEEPRTATIIALTDVELLQLSKSDLELIVKTYPRVGNLLKRYHQQRTTVTLESLHAAFEDLASRTSPETPAS